MSTGSGSTAVNAHAADNLNEEHVERCPGSQCNVDRNNSCLRLTGRDTRNTMATAKKQNSPRNTGGEVSWCDSFYQAETLEKKQLTFLIVSSKTAFPECSEELVPCSCCTGST